MAFGTLEVRYLCALNHLIAGVSVGLLTEMSVVASASIAPGHIYTDQAMLLDYDRLCNALFRTRQQQS